MMELAPIGLDPRDLAVRAAPYLPTLLVDHPMVKRAQTDQIVEVGWSSLRPELDVVSVDPSAVVATRESTSLIPPVRAPGHPRGNCARGPTDANY